MFKKFHKIKYNRGMTLVELVVVMVIFVVLSGMVMLSYGKFSSSVSTQNLADDIALAIRKAQSYAIGVRSINNDFSYGYGIHIAACDVATCPPTAYSGSPSQFILFANLDNDQKYDNVSDTCGNISSGNECLEAFNITGSDYIQKVDVIYGTESWVGVGIIDIFFKRPNPEPTLCFRWQANRTADLCGYTNIPRVILVIGNMNDTTVTRTITIWNNGQISTS